MARLGTFDPQLEPLAWFDPDLFPVAWFDRDLIPPDGAVAPIIHYLAPPERRARVPWEQRHKRVPAE